MAPLDSTFPVVVLLLLTTSYLIGVRGKTVINYNMYGMARSEIINYFRTLFQTRISSFDSANEEAYSDQSFSEDLYHNIDNLMPRPVFARYLMKTKNITDKVDEKGASLLSKYLNEPNGKCHAETVFNSSVAEILKKWDGDRTMVSNIMEQWHITNADKQPYQLCNRFRGLSCQYKYLEEGSDTPIGNDSPTCQCTGDPENIKYYRSPAVKPQAKPSDQNNMYPDGCYVRPWKPCVHLSVDYHFRDTYHAWHTSTDNYRRQLAQIVFPVSRIHRCRRGTYCMDMIPGMKKPVCWCTPASTDLACISATSKLPTKHVPIGQELAQIREKFVALLTNEAGVKCNPKYNPLIEKLVDDAGKDPSVTLAVNVMKQLVTYASNSKVPIRLCDFRESMFCNLEKRVCEGKVECEPGQIHLGKGVCAVDNAHLCVSDQDCVMNANCERIPGTIDSVCVCEHGYGPQCKLQNPPFFSTLFTPVTSGFKGDEYVKLQVRMNAALEAWEDAMTKDIGETCDPLTDPPSMALVNYFGNLVKYDNTTGERLLMSAKDVIKDTARFCRYNKFLRCHSESKKCVPIIGHKIINEEMKGVGSGVPGAIHIQRKPNADCTKGGIPAIFKDLITIHCPPGYECMLVGVDRICKADCDSPIAPKNECPMRRKKSTNAALDAALRADVGDGGFVSARAAGLKGRQEGETGESTPPPTDETGEATPPPTDETGEATPPPTDETGESTPPPTDETGQSSTPPTDETGQSSTPPTDGQSSTPPTDGTGQSSTPPTDGTGQSTPTPPPKPKYPGRMIFKKNQKSRTV